MRVAQAVWENDGAGAAIARALLLPVSAAYRGVTAFRNALYDRNVLAVEPSAIPVVSVGNLSVGGTGKTPVSAWIATRLRDSGARPALVMRGYGGDEQLVHATLNPGVPVHANANRAAALRAAAAAGCDVAVLDDGFQHRRVQRLEDIVLVSADRWREPIRLLPAGPWREGPRALRRASLLIVTRKAASAPDAERLMQRLAALTGRGEGAVAALTLGALRDARSGAERPLSDLNGARVLAVAGVGDPRSFRDQLIEAGARVTMRVFPDHHVYESSDGAAVARDVTSFEHVVCTMKDAVKLAPIWPREAGPLWYVSLRCRIEVGGAEVSALLDRFLAARRSHVK
jgi:tetraacyldisaccharide 4'-kinase